MKRAWTAQQIINQFGGGVALVEEINSLPGWREPVASKTCHSWGQRDSIPGHFLYPIYLAARRRRPMLREITPLVLLEHAARGVFDADQTEETGRNGDNGDEELEGQASHGGEEKGQWPPPFCE